MFNTISTETNDQVLLKGVRYSNPGKQPILLIPGFMETTYIYHQLAQLLKQSGLDVFTFNMRGHGHGDFRSKAIEGIKANYGFEYIATQDIEAMIEYVYKETGKKVVVAGHSTGGMTSRLALGGLELTEDGLSVNEDESKRLSSMVSKVLLLAAPPSMDNDYGNLKIFDLGDLIGSRILKYSQSALIFTPETHDYEGQILQLETDKVSGKVFDRVAKFFSRRGISKGLMEGIYMLDNYDKKTDEDLKILKYGLSEPELDLIRDFRRYYKKGYISADGKVKLQDVRIPSHIPVGFVSAQFDKLARPEHVLVDFHDHTNLHPSSHYVMFKGLSHIDLISARMSVGFLSEYMISFIENEDTEKLTRLLRMSPKAFLLEQKEALSLVSNNQCLQSVFSLM